MQDLVRPAGVQTAAQPYLLGLIGSPIKSSAAPAMHEAAAVALGLSAHYRLIDVPGADEATLRKMLDGVRLLGFSGVNVTFPYKQMAVACVDELAPEAAFIGATNSVVVRDRRLVGYNTDATGFAAAFREVFGNPGDRPVALVGAGGVGCAIAYALTQLGAREIRVYDTDRAKADDLAERLSTLTASSACDTIKQTLDGAGVLINATPVGMLPSRESPMPAALLHRDLWVADAVYTPLWTPLLQAARERGARVMTGRELCICQAVDAFRLFTGLEPSRERIAAAFDAVIARRGEPADIYTPTRT